MKVFIAGARAITYLELAVLNRLENIFKKQYTVFVGDASGVDSFVQKFFAAKNYKNLSVFASNGIARNNLGNWQVVNVPVNGKTKGFDFYVAKDIEMANKADCGFMIWNGESKGTFNNIINLLKQNKITELYYTPNKKFYTIRNFEDLDLFIKNNVKLSFKLTKMIPPKPLSKNIQMQLIL
ncbi:MAG: hypothetical protein LBR56_07890 [Sporomusaceae bacterium]|jgi:hypothetical protein|nr:hypothetical protein [Sporomusaceae bacterium]